MGLEFPKIVVVLRMRTVRSGEGRRQKAKGSTCDPFPTKGRSLVNVDVYLRRTRSSAQVYVHPLPYAPSLRKDEAAPLVPVTADFGCGSRKKGGTTEKNLCEES